MARNNLCAAASDVVLTKKEGQHKELPLAYSLHVCIIQISFLAREILASFTIVNCKVVNASFAQDNHARQQCSNFHALFSRNRNEVELK